MAYDEGKPKKAKERKALAHMSLVEIRNWLTDIQFSIAEQTGNDAKVLNHWLSMSSDDFRKWYRKLKDKKTVYAASGAIRNGAVIIPNGYETVVPLYEIIDIRIEEMRRIELAKDSGAIASAKAAGI